MDNCSSGMSNSGRSRWRIAEQTEVQVQSNHLKHPQCSNMTLMTQRQETLIRAMPGYQIHLVLKKPKVTFSSWPTHWRIILKDWNNKCITATKQHRGVNEDTLHQSQNTANLTNLRRWACCQTSYQGCQGSDYNKWKPRQV